MPIRQMINTREPGTPREFQQRLTVVGKIRLGVFATPEGRRGRPEKIDTFRFTSPTEGLIRGESGSNRSVRSTQNRSQTRLSARA